MSDFEDIQKLIRLKRHEAPPAEYFDEFLSEFQRRQRSELLRRSARSILMERVSTYFSDFGKRNWVYAAGAAYALIMVGFYFNSRGAGEPAGSGSAGNLAVTDEKISLWDSPMTISLNSEPRVTRFPEPEPAEYRPAELPPPIVLPANYLPAASKDGHPDGVRSKRSNTQNF